MPGKKSFFNRIAHDKKLTPRKISAMRNFYFGDVRHFPTAEEYIQRLGYDPKIIRQLTDRPVRVRMGDAGALHKSIDPVFWSDKKRTPDKIEVNSYVTMMRSKAYEKMPCRLVTLCDENRNMYEAIKNSLFLDAVDESIFSPGRFLEKSINHLAAFLHEIAHTDSSQTNMSGRLCEADADIRSLTAIEQLFKHKEITRIIILWRALDMDSERYGCLSLYLDAFFSGHPISEEEALAAQQELITTAWPKVKKYEDANIFLPIPDWDFVEFTRSIEISLRLKHENFPLSYHAQRQFDLMLEAAEYFMKPLCDRIKNHIAKTDYHSAVDFNGFGPELS